MLRPDSSTPKLSASPIQAARLGRNPWIRTALGCLLILLVASCGGGGGGAPGDEAAPVGGGGGPTKPLNPKKDFFLSAGYYARPILDPTSAELIQVVNPASLYETDPITGVPLPGFPKPLIPGSSLNTLTSLNFAQILDPLTPQIPLVPRNAAVVLEFTRSIDADSVLLSNLDPVNPGLITLSSTVQVYRKDGSFVPARAKVFDKRLAIIPFVDSTTGWEASPLVFDKFGNAIADPQGWLRVAVGVGAGELQSADGLGLKDRPDLLGTTAKPLPFNPGNSKLDAIVQQTESGTITFNGFLPDLTAPRIIRGVELVGTVESVGLSAGLPAITGAPLGSPANVAANGGDGEWALSLLTVTGAGGLVTQYVVDHNVNDLLNPSKPVFVLSAGTIIDPSVGAGSTFKVQRSEFYEPVPPPLPTNAADLADVTVDPENHPRDPNDPQDAHNHDLRYFARMYDPNGVEQTSVWNPSTGLFQPVPPKVSIKLRFSEPMDAKSFMPFEDFYVTNLSIPVTDPAFNKQRIGRTVGSEDGREISFEPVLLNQLDPGADEFIGFGGTAASLRLTLRTIPELADIDAVKSSVSPAELAKLIDLNDFGVAGVTDLGGRGLGLPEAILDQSDGSNFFLEASSPGLGAFPPAIDFSFAFQTQATADPDWGAVVHRFMGAPKTAIFQYPPSTPHDTVASGIQYHDYPPLDSNEDGTIDRVFLYGPSLLDAGLNLPGRLTGAPASVLEHLIDNFNKPKASPYSSPNGEEDSLIKIAFGLSTPLNSKWGARFQHVYRAGDASPAYNDYHGVVLDLVGLAWSPLNIANSTLDDMEILVGLSGVGNGNGPDTTEQSGIPQADESGLVAQFDCNMLEWTKSCCLIKPAFDNSLLPFMDGEPKMTTVVSAGTPYKILTTQLFAPANAAGLAQSQFNFYLNYPTFNAGLDPFFNKTNVFAFPYDSRFPMLIEYRLKPQLIAPSNNNRYRFSPGIQSSVLPRFRVWSQGQDPYAHCIAPCQSICAVAAPCRGGEGGPLLEPGTFTSTVKAPNPKGDGVGGKGPNGTQDIVPPAAGYILPPQIINGASCTPNQPVPDWGSYTCGNPQTPRCNSLPEMNWYHANGMFMNPLPNPSCWPGTQGIPPSSFYGYGPSDNPGAFPPNCPTVITEPNYLQNPSTFGDNSRYHMLWKYRKRISLVESPTIQVDATTVTYGLPFIDPPLAATDPNAGLRVEFRASTEIDFSVPVLDSGYVDQSDPDFIEQLNGVDGNRIFIKFRATFGVAAGEQQPPSIDTVVIPYLKVTP